MFQAVTIANATGLLTTITDIYQKVSVPTTKSVIYDNVNQRFAISIVSMNLTLNSSGSLASQAGDSVVLNAVMT
jgi:hypothetical protein